MNKTLQPKQSDGFTIVELLIVIVVIGILAAISIVAYNGIQIRAIDTTTKNDVTQAAKQLEISKIESGNYPASASEANDNKGLAKSDTTEYLYTNSGEDYQLTGYSTRSGTKAYCITSDSRSAQEGSCQGHTVPDEPEDDVVFNIGEDSTSRPANTLISNLAYGNGYVIGMHGSDDGDRSRYAGARTNNRGETWQEVGPYGLNWFTNNIFCANTFLASMQHSYGLGYYHSSDGLSWTYVDNAATDGKLRNIHCVNNEFRALADSGYVKSSNAISWQPSTRAPQRSNTINSELMSLESGRVNKSSDGYTWTAINAPGLSNRDWSNPAMVRTGNIVAVSKASGGGNTYYVAISEDAGASWTQQTVSSLGRSHYGSIGDLYYDKGHLFFGNGAGEILISSDDGANWTAKPTSLTSAASWVYTGECMVGAYYTASTWSCN